jgi:hypothetical protein
MKNYLTTILFLFLCATAFSQKVNLNKYKYVIVSSKFNFVKQVDGYQTSSLTKFLFKKAGFNTFLDNEEIPEELLVNKCNALFASVEDDSGVFTTKSSVVLKDCRGKLVFSSEEGSSRLKAYKKAYRQSIKEAFSSIEKLGYVYDPTINDEVVVSEKVVTPITKKKKEVKEPIMVIKKVVTDIKNTMYPLLYAQKTNNGFQLVNTKPEVVFILLKTNDSKKFFIKDKNGTIINKGSYWLAEYYKDGKLVSEKYSVKF